MPGTLRGKPVRTKKMQKDFRHPNPPGPDT